MKTQGQRLYTGMLRLVTFSLMQSSSQKYQILDWQSCMMTRKHTSAPELQAQCELLQLFLWNHSIATSVFCYGLYLSETIYIAFIHASKKGHFLWLIFILKRLVLIPAVTKFKFIPLLGNLLDFLDLEYASLFKFIGLITSLH